MAYTFRAKYKNEGTDILSHKKSSYNSKIIIDSCGSCGIAMNLEVHHINHQADADSNGIICGEAFHKNIEHNLMVLCHICHKKIHKLS